VQDSLVKIDKPIDLPVIVPFFNDLLLRETAHFLSFTHVLQHKQSHARERSTRYATSKLNPASMETAEP